MGAIEKNKKRKNNWELPISKQINVNFRNYALYVLENRGIPSFYDALTNVQRLILLSAPTSFDKTVSLVGTCFKEGYHHGDAGLIGAINKLARPFNCADEMLLGDGFFGSSVDNAAAAARYTSVKINNKFKEIIKESHFLNTRDEEKKWDSLWVDIPIGLVTSIVGIAVGYKTTILPRSIEDIRNYFDGKIKEVFPSFKNFTGKVERYESLDRTWLISGEISFDDKNRSILITDLPPLLRYKSFLKKLNKIFEKFENRASVENNSTMKANLKILFKGDKEDWDSFKHFVEKATKILVTENPVFIKNGLVLEYNRIEDYLDDFKYRRAELNLRRSEYFLKTKDSEILFTKAKIEFLSFMLEKKRTEQEIDKFLLKFTKEISNKLNTILLRHLSDDELKRLEKNIIQFEKDKKGLEKEVSSLQKIFNKLTDTATKRGIKSISSVDLFLNENISELDGIEVFSAKDEEDEEFNEELKEE